MSEQKVSGVAVDSGERGGNGERVGTNAKQRRKSRPNTQEEIRRKRQRQKEKKRKERKQMNKKEKRKLMADKREKQRRRFQEEIDKKSEYAAEQRKLATIYLKRWIVERRRKREASM